MAAPRPGNPDRGWNDPPIFNYTPKTSGHASPRGTKLNKRIAYTGGAVNTQLNTAGSGTLLNPASGPPISPVQLLPPIQLLPPTTNTAPSAPVPLVIPMMGSVTPLNTGIESNNKSTTIDSQSTDLADILEYSNISSDDELFDKVKQKLDSEFERCLPRLQGRAAEDIKKKLQILKENWKDKKLSKDVQVRIWEILQALENKEYDKAWESHLSLMVDYTAEVGQWLVAVKRIIHENREMRKEEESSVKQETDKDLKSDSDAANLIDVSDPKISSSSVLTLDDCTAVAGDIDRTGSSVDG
ncbi:steroid receptor RNA activator 1-like [Mizuhopecten yessoensis]|uniref:Steroid receptor RNA activator 1 n=1 Tax=Mizuhopecten yessoensis TaxID=6573 RepID=A0A210QVY0_MIZYE|nr:steroid receptor RNA activator 1-like [Mizuhopecten yessoensis]OWF52919.1 Steroid receptor RNA activator 1 [Mizuhopecten yessoensis]